MVTQHTYVKEKTFTEANTITHISPITKLMIINVNAWNYIKKQKKNQHVVGVKELCQEPTGV